MRTWLVLAGLLVLFPAAPAAAWAAGAAASPAQEIETLQRLAEGGNARAMGLYGRALFLDRAGDPREAVRWLRKGAELGDGFSMFILSIAYDTGRGVATDKGEAERLRRAARALGQEVTAVGDPAALTSAENFEAFKAHVDRLLARDDPAGEFENATVRGRARVRHKASGLVCGLSDAREGEDQILFADRLDGVREASCVTGSGALRTTLTVYRAPAGFQAEAEMARWSAALLAQEPGLKVAGAGLVAGQTEDRPASRFTEAWLAGPGPETITRLSVTVIDGWAYRERLDSSVFLWRSWPKGTHFSVLARALPLPADLASPPP